MIEILLMALPGIVIPPVLIGIWAAVQRRRHPPSTEALEAAGVLGDFRWPPSGLAAAVFCIVYLGAHTAGRLMAMPGALRIALVAAPLLAFVWFSYAFLRESRGGDEFERRIQGEAAAQALWMFMFWSVGMWVMDEVWFGSRRGSFNAALGFLPFFYVVGMFFAKGKYMPTAKTK